MWNGPAFESRPRGAVPAALAVLVTVMGCAVATSDPVDASVEDAAPAIALGDLRPLAPGEMPRLDAAPATKPPAGTGDPPDLGPSAPTAAPTAAPTGPPTAAPTGPPTAAPTAAPTAPPTAAPTAPPPEPECQTDEDCGGGDHVCFGEFCVIDPAAPHRVGDGACTNEADEALIRANPAWRSISEACALTCLGQMQPCVDACVASQSGFSAGCAACYGAWVSCVSSICLIPCVFNDDDADCAECRANVCDRPLGVCGGFAAPQYF